MSLTAAAHKIVSPPRKKNLTNTILTAINLRHAYYHKQLPLSSQKYFLPQKYSLAPSGGTNYRQAKLGPTIYVWALPRALPLGPRKPKKF